MRDKNVLKDDLGYCFHQICNLVNSTNKYHDNLENIRMQKRIIQKSGLIVMNDNGIDELESLIEENIYLRTHMNHLKQYLDQYRKLHIDDEQLDESFLNRSLANLIMVTSKIAEYNLFTLSQLHLIYEKIKLDYEQEQDMLCIDQLFDCLEMFSNIVTYDIYEFFVDKILIRCGILYSF